MDITKETYENALLAKLRLENFYKTIIVECTDREARRKELAENPEDPAGKRALAALGKRESEFLRQRRVKLGIVDFSTLKIIGKGAVFC